MAAPAGKVPVTSQAIVLVPEQLSALTLAALPPGIAVLGAGVAVYSKPAGKTSVIVTEVAVEGPLLRKRITNSTGSFTLRSSAP